jgi:hypothetical protein
MPVMRAVPPAAIKRMTKGELLGIIERDTQANSFVALCASDRLGTTNQLRTLARTLGIADLGVMATKQQLGDALASHHHAPPPALVVPEDADIPSLALDLVTQDILVDPIVASDGHTYGYASLRNMFVLAQRTFVSEGCPTRRPVCVRSLHDPSMVLANPFSDIPNLPATFPLVRNVAVKQFVDAWLWEHGLAAPRVESEPPIASVRDQDGFENGIFYEVDDLLDYVCDESWVPDPDVTYRYLCEGRTGVTLLMALAAMPNATARLERALLDHSREDARKQDSLGWTALMYAVFSGGPNPRTRAVVKQPTSKTRTVGRR